MKTISIFFLFSVMFGGFCFPVSAEENTPDSELHDDLPTKPTREQIVAFLDDYRNHRPLTEAEKKVGWEQREKVDLDKEFGADFSGLDLNGIDFDVSGRKTLGNGIDFSRCNMQNASFDGAELKGCRFTNTDLSGALLRYCELENADFTGAKLEHTRIPYSEMQNVRFENLDASSVKFYGVDFSRAVLRGTNFSGAFFSRPKFFHVDLTGADMSGAELTHAKFHHANLENIDFLKANLHLAEFIDVNLQGTDFTGASLYAATFSRVKGIDDSQLKSLQRRSARWFYDLLQNVYQFFVLIYYPTYLLVGIIVVISTIKRLFQAEKTRLFILAAVLNGFALFSTATTFLMLFSGGHPVRQMSGNWNVWSNWLAFYPFPLFGLMICILTAGVLLLIMLCLLIFKWRQYRPWKLFFYQILTLIHCLQAFTWLIMFMPDA